MSQQQGRMWPLVLLGGVPVTPLSPISCNSSCPAGTFGDGCQLLCPECVWGSCDPVSGDCLCQAGYWGAR